MKEAGGTVTERNFNTICEKFSVNPKWLRFGVGEMFLADSVDTYIDKVVAEKKLTAKDRALIETMLELPPAARNAFVEFAQKLVANARVQPTEQEQDDERLELEKIIADAQKRLARLDALKSKRTGSSP